MKGGTYYSAAMATLATIFSKDRCAQSRPVLCRPTTSDARARNDVTHGIRHHPNRSARCNIVGLIVPQRFTGSFWRVPQFGQSSVQSKADGSPDRPLSDHNQRLDHLGGLTARDIRRARRIFCTITTGDRIADESFGRGQPFKYTPSIFGVLHSRLRAGRCWCGHDDKDISRRGPWRIRVRTQSIAVSPPQLTTDLFYPAR